jgi:hypothetical protein
LGGVCSTYWEVRNANKILVGRPEGKMSLGKTWNEGRIDIKIVLNETERSGKVRLDLAA